MMKSKFSRVLIVAVSVVSVVAIAACINPVTGSTAAQSLLSVALKSDTENTAGAQQSNGVGADATAAIGVEDTIASGAWKPTDNVAKVPANALPDAV